MTFRATVNVSGAQRVLGKLPSKVEAGVYSAFSQTANHHIGRMRIRMRAGGGSVTTRSGKLQGSFQREIRRTGKLGDLSMRLFSAGVSYATIQEHGGVVRPNPPRKYLAVPTDDNRTSGGVARLSMSPSEYDPGRTKTFILRLKSGGLYIVERRGNDLAFLWRLVRSVRITGRLGWFDLWRTSSRIFLGIKLREALAKATGEAAAASKGGA